MSDEHRWQVVQARGDGSFFYSVDTTGVFCRPSCKSRRPLRKNVAFHDTPADAVRAGFRPCKRCQPERPTDAASLRVQEMCRFIEQSDVAPKLDALARHVGLSRFHAQRLFKQETGVTPRAYAAAYRKNRLRDALTSAQSVTNAIYDAGYNSAGRFYAEADATLGMTPRQFRAGGAQLPIRFAIAECSLGAILVAASTRGVCSIALGDAPEALLRELHDRFPHAELIGADPAFEATVALVIGLIEQPRQAVMTKLPLDIRGTVFQQRVWQALTRIPVGKTMSYSQVARAIGAPRAARAVAAACAANSLAVAIPCHRVVRTSGELSGYRWGIERKRTLIEREKAR